MPPRVLGVLYDAVLGVVGWTGEDRRQEVEEDTPGTWTQQRCSHPLAWTSTGKGWADRGAELTKGAWSA